MHLRWESGRRPPQTDILEYSPVGRFDGARPAMPAHSPILSPPSWTGRQGNSGRVPARAGASVEDETPGRSFAPLSAPRVRHGRHARDRPNSEGLQWDSRFVVEPAGCARWVPARARRAGDAPAIGGLRTCQPIPMDAHPRLPFAHVSSSQGPRLRGGGMVSTCGVSSRSSGSADGSTTTFPSSSNTSRRLPSMVSPANSGHSMVMSG